MQPDELFEAELKRMKVRSSIFVVAATALVYCFIFFSSSREYGFTPALACLPMFIAALIPIRMPVPEAAREKARRTFLATGQMPKGSWTARNFCIAMAGLLVVWGGCAWFLYGQIQSFREDREQRRIKQSERSARPEPGKSLAAEPKRSNIRL